MNARSGVRGVEQLGDRLAERIDDRGPAEVLDHAQHVLGHGLGAAEDAERSERREQRREGREHRVVGEGRRDVLHLVDAVLVHGAGQDDAPVVVGHPRGVVGARLRPSGAVGTWSVRARTRRIGGGRGTRRTGESRRGTSLHLRVGG